MLMTQPIPENMETYSFMVSGYQAPLFSYIQGEGLGNHLEGEIWVLDVTEEECLAVEREPLVDVSSVLIKNTGPEIFPTTKHVSMQQDPYNRGGHGGQQRGGHTWPT